MIATEADDYGHAPEVEITEPKRPRPYVWPSWITKLLAGESKCWYSAWYKAQHKYLKVPDDPDRADFFEEYNRKHDAITERRAKELMAEGWIVKVEEQGEFRVKGKLGDISGKPDIVAMKDDVAKVVDAKSGKRRQSDHWQVLLYTLLLPMSWLKGFKEIQGEVEYADGTAEVRPITAEEKERITSSLRLIMGPTAPEATPSAGDCKFCDIARCQYRYKAPEGSAEGMF